MRSSLLTWLAALALGSPLLAAAAPVTFSFDTTVIATEFGWSGPPAGLGIGDPIAVSASFDSDANPLIVFQSGSGTRTDFDPATLSITYTAKGASYTRSATGSMVGLVRLRDNANDPDPTYFPELVDGLTFQIDDGIGEAWQLTLRGPTLDLITNGKLPTFQDDRWGNQRTA